MFLDEVKAFFKGGRGGNGCASTLRLKYLPRGGPDGGNGGRGGDCVLEASVAVNTLVLFWRQRHFKAEAGRHGSSNNKFGHGGEDRVVPVPLGTVVRTENGETLADLLLTGERFVAARGGRGGRGSAALATRANPVPRFAERGEPGEERWLSLELKLLADVGLVGYPNAGKSTLLSRVTAARPKIADYPFTTTVPHLGVVTLSDYSSFVLADIPGLVEGAHVGKGLGTRFLKHIERCRMLVHLIDLSAWDGDPVDKYRSIRRELEGYGAQLAGKPELVVGTKLDVPGTACALEATSRRLRKKVLGVSAVTGEGVPALLATLAARLARLPVGMQREEIVHRFTLEADFSVESAGGGQFRVRGRTVESLVAMTDLANREAVEALERKLKRLGLGEKLENAGATPGDTITIGRYEFLFEGE